MSARDFVPFPSTMRAPCLWYRREPNGPLYNWPVQADQSVVDAAVELLRDQNVSVVSSYGRLRIWKR